MQNEYNTPAAQIARMREAGIDVNPMTYAVGNGSMATTAGSISPGTYASSGVNPISTAMSMMSGIKELTAKDAQIDQTKTNTEQTRMAMYPALSKMYQEIDAQEIRNAVDRHNLNWAKRHNMPVGQVPEWTRDIYNELKPDVVSKAKSWYEDYVNFVANGFTNGFWPKKNKDDYNFY